MVLLINSKLAFLRKKHKLTQEFVANKIGLSLYKYRKLESGEELPSADQVKTLAKFFCVEQDFLLPPGALNGLTTTQTKKNEIIKRISDMPDVWIPDILLFLDFLEYRRRG